MTHMASPPSLLCLTDLSDPDPSDPDPSDPDPLTPDPRILRLPATLLDPGSSG